SSLPKASSIRKGSRRRCSGWVSTRVSFTPAPSEVARPATRRSTRRDSATVAVAGIGLLVMADLLAVRRRRTPPPDGPDSGERGLDVGARLGEALLGRVLAHVQAFGVDEADVGHAEKVQYALQVGRLGVGRGAAIAA